MGSESQDGPPELVAHERHGRGAVPGILVAEQSAERRPDAQSLEGVRRDDGALEAARFSLAEQGGLEAPEAGQRFEGALTRPEVDEVANGDVGLGEAGLDVAVPEHDEPVGLVERKRPQQDSLDDGEQSRVGADPQREREDGGRGKGRLAPEDRSAWRTSWVHMPCLDDDFRPDVLRGDEANAPGGERRLAGARGGRSE